MTSKFIIDAALKLRREYGNIYNLIRDKGIILKYVDLDSSIRGLSVDNVIFINIVGLFYQIIAINRLLLLQYQHNLFLTHNSELV